LLKNIRPSKLHLNTQCVFAAHSSIRTKLKANRLWKVNQHETNSLQKQHRSFCEAKNNSTAPSNEFSRCTILKNWHSGYNLYLQRNF